MNKHYPENHPIEALRGHDRPKPTRIRRWMKKTIKFLDEKREVRLRKGDANGVQMIVDDMAVLAEMFAAWEAVNPARDE